MPGPGQLHVYDSKGQILRTVSFGQRTDPGFFKQLVAQARTQSKPIQAGLALSIVAGIMLVMACIANIGNPFLFYDRRERWKDLHGNLKGSAWDVWITYFSEISGNWKGHAVDTLQQYLRFKLIGMFDQLGSLAKDMTNTMNNQYKDVMQYDVSIGALLASAGPMFKTLKTMSAHPGGRIVLLTHAGVFLTAAANLLKQFSDTYNTYESELKDLELKLHEVQGIFYNQGKPDMGVRDLHVHPDVAKIDHWQPAVAEEAR